MIDSALMDPLPAPALVRSVVPDVVSMRVIAAPELIDVITDLSDLFVETVNGGSPLGFMPPITRDTARDYWISLLPELRSLRRILLVAMAEGRVIGSAQLELSRRGNSPHRATVEKVFVGRSARGRGVGTFLMNAIEDVALQHGRTLLLLNTRFDLPPHRWYQSLGYRDVGVIPGWTIGANGERFDHVSMYKELRTRT
ncbi:MAG TPA: GNAT family N-acetyltransferase [Gemmatimonadaceae bacterium]|nr:GNAT family N-acetyltransferase [Gemmatimonadaceae bacterium]